MKTTFNRPALIFAGILLGGFAAVTALATDETRNVIVTASADADDPPTPPTAPPPPGQKHVFTHTITNDRGQSAGRQMTWLGVGVEDTSEPLAAQLNLKPGEGVVVNYVSTNSPAAAAGLRKNDVLVELEGQMLVDPAQLRKLVQMYADGDSVKVGFYRAGKKQFVSAKLVKKPADENPFDEEIFPGGSRKLQLRLQDLEGLAGAKGNLNIEIRRTMEQAQQALEKAMQQSLNGTDGFQHKLEIIQKKLGHLAEGGVNVGKDATVVVKSQGETIRTIVKKDEHGSYVIVADPAKHLTVHDADGKLLFDGAIESPEDQEKVPREVWKTVEPMLEDLGKDAPVGGKPSGQDSSLEN